VGRALDAAEDLIARRTGPQGDAERRVYLHASERVGRCRLEIKDFVKKEPARDSRFGRRRETD
jgi:hypothetical protein